MNLETGWTPTIAEYHALAVEGVVSSSMLLDLVPPGRPRLYKSLYLDQTVHKGLVGVDAWRGTIVDMVLTEGGKIGFFDGLGRGVATASGQVIGVIPPKFDMRKTVDKQKWTAWKEACAREGVGLIGLSTDANGKEKRQLTDAQNLLDEVEHIADFIISGKTPAAELAREILQGGNGVSQLSHRFTWNSVDCRWRPDRLVKFDQQVFPGTIAGKPSLWDVEAVSADYAHVSLKVTMHAHPGPFWTHYQSDGWGMRDAFYELGWSFLTGGTDIASGRFDNIGEFPWLTGEEGAVTGGETYSYADPEPLDWIVVAAHHKPVPEVFVHVVPENQRRLGRKRCTEALHLLKHCLDTNDWTLPEEREAQLGRDPRAWEWSP